MRRVLIVVGAPVASITPGSAVAQVALAPLAANETLLSVEAEGVAKARPDLMLLTAGVVTTGATAQNAVAENNRQLAAMLAAVRTAGIEASDIRTTNFSVKPRFAGDDREDAVITGYVASNQVEIRFRDLSRADALITTLFAAGANSVGGPRFGLSDAVSTTRSAERAALAAARVEAENYASALGMRIARVLRVSDRQFSTDRWSDAIVVTGSRVQPTPIEPGEIEVEAKVFVDFALVPR